MRTSLAVEAQSQARESTGGRAGGGREIRGNRLAQLDVALFTGGIDRPYVFGISTGLAAKGIRVDVIGSDTVDSPEMHATPGLTFLNLQRTLPKKANLAKWAWRVLILYVSLFRYAARSKAQVFHILWNNKLQMLDRTLLMNYHKLLGKKIVLTVHNVNTDKRDGTDTWLNRLTLRHQYRSADHMFVHTQQMKTELIQDFGVRDSAVTVIPFGINNSVPDTSLTSQEAKRRLGIEEGKKTILFFGRIGPYKGLELLASSFKELASGNPDYTLIIAGAPKKGGEAYIEGILDTLRDEINRGAAIPQVRFIPDEDTEIYFKAADAVILPYTEVYQSGVLFLSFSFGTPVIAADIGSFSDDILPGQTGFLFKSRDTGDLARTIETYFASPLYKNLSQERPAIRDFANQQHSWDVVGEMTRSVYTALIS